MLRRIIALFFVTLVTMGLFIHDADARRFGGGRSFGMSRSVNSFSRSTPASGLNNYSRSQNTFGQTGSTFGRSFLPSIIGLGAGLLLGSLFMGHGFGAGLLSWLLVGSILMMLINFWRQKNQPRNYYQYQSPEFVRNATSAFMHNSQSTAHHSQPIKNDYPIGFDATTFLRDAKAQYLRLQTAYDAKNLSDLREFTTPEVFAEIQLQLHERGEAENHTNVMRLEAELLDVEPRSQNIGGTEMETYVASVKFAALLQEERDKAAEQVSEIWHFIKEVGSARWKVAGLQQG